MKKSEASKAGGYFLLIVIIIYIITYLFKPDFLIPSLKLFSSIIIKIIPVFILVFAIMFVINYFVTPKWLVKKLEKGNGARAWAIAITAGIISTGPIYMWYPLLAELQEHKIRNGLVAAFLYARAVKPALIPLMILYFGLSFTIILSIVMIIFSVIQGKTLESLENIKFSKPRKS